MRPRVDDAIDQPTVRPVGPSEVARAVSDPAHQGRGIGGALLGQTLARVDEQHVHAYLESSNPANVPLYRRHGFEVIREIRVGSFPPVIPMVRLPR